MFWTDTRPSLLGLVLPRDGVVAVHAFGGAIAATNVVRSSRKAAETIAADAL